jgi:hypothetical protein
LLQQPACGIPFKTPKQKDSIKSEENEDELSSFTKKLEAMFKKPSEDEVKDWKTKTGEGFVSHVSSIQKLAKTRPNDSKASARL